MDHAGPLLVRARPVQGCRGRLPPVAADGRRGRQVARQPGGEPRRVHLQAGRGGRQAGRPRRRRAALPARGPVGADRDDPAQRRLRRRR
jgi:hypothetical protein